MATKELSNPGAFFTDLRSGLLGPTLSEEEVAGTNAIVAAVGQAGWPLSWAAYGLATAYHETAHSMKPIKEFGGPTYFRRMYDIQGARPTLARKMGNTAPGDGVRYCGRGYVQLTWKNNYQRAQDELGVDLVANPDLAMDLNVAARVMVRGMSEGWFTGLKCSRYLPGSGSCDRASFSNARRIINGTDKAGLIAGYALQFQTALEAGGWH